MFDLESFLERNDDFKDVHLNKKRAYSFKDSLKLAEKLQELEFKYSMGSLEDMKNLSFKIKILFAMLDEFKAKGNKVLIFSKTKIFLDLFENLVNKSFSLTCIDKISKFQIWLSQT